MTDQTPPGDGWPPVDQSAAEQSAADQSAKQTASRRADTQRSDANRTAAKRTAARRRTEEHDTASTGSARSSSARSSSARDVFPEEFYDEDLDPDNDDSYARFRRPPPGKPALLPEEPPRALDDTPVAGFSPDELEPLEHVRTSASSPALSWDDESLLKTAKRVLNGAAFVLPLVVVFSLYALVVALIGDEDTALTGDQTASPPGDATLIAPSPENSPPPNAQWPADVAFAPHTVPALIKDEITVLGGRMGYSFNGEAGTVWAITVEPSDDTLDPKVTLYAPSGPALVFNDNRAAGIAASDLVVRLPESGVYRVLVESSPAVPSTGPYLLALFEQ